MNQYTVRLAGELAARDLRPALLPRRNAPDRYQPRPLTDEQVAHFYARVDAAREKQRKTAATRYAGNAGAIRRALEERGLGAGARSGQSDDWGAQMKSGTNAEMMDAETRRKASQDAQTFAMQTTRAAQDALLLDSHRGAMLLGSRFVVSWEESSWTNH